MSARILLPEKARRGAAVEARIVIRHAQETGFRKDEVGWAVNYNVVEELRCEYAGQLVFRARMSSGVAPLPALAFWLRATESGPVLLHWRTTPGETGRAEAMLHVE